MVHYPHIRIFRGMLTDLRNDFGRAPRLFLILALVPTLLNLIATLGGALGKDNWLLWSGGMVFQLALLWPLSFMANGITAHVLLLSEKGQQPTLTKLAERARERYAMALITMVRVNLTIFFGMFLLIVPGVWFWIHYYFASTIVMSTDDFTASGDAMLESKRMVRRNRLEVFALSLLFLAAPLIFHLAISRALGASITEVSLSAGLLVLPFFFLFGLASMLVSARAFIRIRESAEAQEV